MITGRLLGFDEPVIGDREIVVEEQSSPADRTKTRRKKRTAFIFEASSFGVLLPVPVRVDGVRIATADLDIRDDGVWFGFHEGLPTNLAIVRPAFTVTASIPTTNDRFLVLSARIDAVEFLTNPQERGDTLASVEVNGQTYREYSGFSHPIAPGFREILDALLRIEKLLTPPAGGKEYRCQS